MKPRRYAADILEAAKRLGLSPSAISSRIAGGMPRGQALTLPRGLVPQQPKQQPPRRATMRREPERGVREYLVEVHDTGQRRLVEGFRLPDGGRAAAHVRALVHVDGEAEPRWIAVERLDPAEHGPQPERPRINRESSPRVLDPRRGPR